MTTVTLTDSEVALLSTALWTASEQFEQIAIMSANVRLQEQFYKQQKQTLELRTQFDEAEAVQLVIAR